MLCLVNVTEKIGSNSDFCSILSLSQCPWCRLFSTPGLCCLLSVTGESSQPLSDTFFHSWTLRLGRCIPGAAVTKYQGRRLKRTDIYFFTVMEARGLKSKRQQIASFQRLWGRICSMLLPASSAPGNPWCPLACRPIALLSASVFAWPSPLRLFFSSKDSCHCI